MKKLISLILATIMLLSLAACGGTPASDDESAANTGSASSDNTDASGTEDTSSAEEVSNTSSGLQGSSDELYIMNVFVSGVEYWFPVYAGMKDACKYLGVSCSYGGTTEYDSQAQVDSLYADMAKNPTGIIISPIEESAFVTPINDAVAQGISVVTFASDSPDSDRCAYVTSDNVNEGEIAAQTLCEGMGGTGSVMVLRNPSQENHNRRCDAFIAYVEANYPDISVVADIATNQDEQAGYDAVMSTYQKYPDLGGVFCPEGVSIVGGANAAKELNATGADIKCICVDTNDTLLTMLKDGDMYSLICPDQYMQGWLSMLTCFTNAHPELVNPMNERKATGGNILDITIDNGLSIITSETADYYYCSEYATTLGYADINDMLSPYTAE